MRRRSPNPLGPHRHRKHSDLVREVLRSCNWLPGVFLFPGEVTVAQRGEVVRALGMTGTPDILGWKTWISGPREGWPTVQKRCVPVAFEIKVGRDQLRPEQRSFLERLRQDGGIAAEIRSVEEAVKALDAG